MNSSLHGEYTDTEIKQALDSMGDLKAPGADGMSALFYKQYWETVGSDVVREGSIIAGSPTPKFTDDHRCVR